jgi:hypothetical protein
MQPTDAELLAYLDEALDPPAMAAIEQHLRASPELRERTAQLVRRRDQGEHSVGEVWRRGRLSCPNRRQLGSYLLGTLEPELSDYVDFHLQVVGCRYCDANLQDLRQTQDAPQQTEKRRRKFFESSAGRMREFRDS